MRSIFVFVDKQKLLISGKNADVSRIHGGGVKGGGGGGQGLGHMVCMFAYFMDLLKVGYNCVTFNHCRKQILGREIFCPHHT